jgi:uncharacterized membrane protein
MSLRARVRSYLPPSVRSFPLDLAAVLVTVLLTGLAISLPVVRDVPLRAALSVPFLLVVPGYAFVSVLFPERAEGSDSESRETSRDRLTNLERFVYALGSSIAIVPLAGFTLNATPWGIRLFPMFVVLGVFSVVCTVIAAIRRQNLPPEQRFKLPVGDWYRMLRDDLLPHDTRTDRILNAALAVALVVATASVGYALVDQRDGERYTELYLLTESDDGRLLADDYPTELAIGETYSIVVGIRNHEHERTEYTVVTLLQPIQSGSEPQVLGQQQLDRFEVTIPSNETRRQSREFTPQITGERLRLLFLLYRGSPPANVEADNAYRRVHLWVNVTS